MRVREPEVVGGSDVTPDLESLAHAYEDAGEPMEFVHNWMSASGVPPAEPVTRRFWFLTVTQSRSLLDALTDRVAA